MINLYYHLLFDNRYTRSNTRLKTLQGSFGTPILQLLVTKVYELLIEELASSFSSQLGDLRAYVNMETLTPKVLGIIFVKSAKISLA